MTSNHEYPALEHLKTASTPADIINEELRTARTAPEMQNVILKELGVIYGNSMLAQSFKRFAHVYSEGLVIAGQVVGKEPNSLDIPTRILAFSMGATLATHAELRFDTTIIRQRMLLCQCDHMLPGDYYMDPESTKHDWMLEAMDMQQDATKYLDLLPKETLDAVMQCSEKVFEDFTSQTRGPAEIEFLIGYSFGHRTIKFFRDNFFEDSETTD